MSSSQGFPVFKGLQKPLEFLGIRGRFLTIAAATVGGAFLGFFALNALLGQVTAFIMTLCAIAVGLVTIYVKQKTGLHSKRRDRDIYIYHNLFKR